MTLTKGYKTYIAGALSIIWGIGGLYFGLHGSDAAVAFISGGLGMIGVRHHLESLGLPPEVIAAIKEASERQPKPPAG